MKRTLMLALSALLVTISAALAATGDQDKNERPRRIAISSSGYLGIQIEEVTPEVAGRLRLREERGALIIGVTADTAAAKAGLQKDDVIVRWNGAAVESARQLSRHIEETPAGRTVKLGVLRNGSEMNVNVTLGDIGQSYRRYYGRVGVVPAAPVAPVAPVAPLARVVPAAPRARYVAKPATAARLYAGYGYQLGISLQSMSPQLAEYFGLKDRNGALVTFVHPDSAAARAGVKAGDVILSVGGDTIDSPGRVVQALRSKGEGAVEIQVMRDRQERKLTVQLERGKQSQLWMADEDADIVVSEALAAPLEIGPLHIEGLPLAPVAVPPIQIAPAQVAPMPPAVVPDIRLAPMAAPRIAIPKINIPKVTIPLMRIVLPEMVFRIEV
ncbi:MAG: PDZ domain-containing protein [Blastocatellia bacterium]